MAEALLAALANRQTQALLSLLALEPSYPRRMGALLGLSETEVARRLRRLERLGLVEGKWGRMGKNVKIYRLTTDSVSLRVTKTGFEVRLGQEDKPRPMAPSSLAPAIPVVTEFEGRSKELAQLGGPEAVGIVLGMPGIGKTTLLARFAAQQSAHRPVFWSSLRGIESLPWLANHVALFLAQQGEPALLESIEGNPDPAHLAESTIGAMDRSKAVFILDEVHRATDPAVKSFLVDAVARLQGAKLVLGSREWIAHNPARAGLLTLRLEGLEDADMGQLLAAKGVPVTEAMMPRLRAEVGGHPLGLQLLAQASQSGGGIEALLDRIPEMDLEAWLLREIYEHLGEDERLALSHASLLRTTFTPADLSAIAKKRLEHALVRLRRRLLVQEAKGGLMLHEVVQNFFYSMLQDKKALHARAAAHYLGKGTIEGRLEAMHHFLAAGRRDKVLELLEQNLDLQDFDFIDAGYHGLYKSILDLFPRSEVPDDRMWGLIQDEKADIAFKGGDLQGALALYRETLDVFAAADQAERCADVNWKIALALERLGKPADAWTLVVKALASAPEGTAKGRLVEVEGRLRASHGRGKKN